MSTQIVNPDTNLAVRRLGNRRLSDPSALTTKVAKHMRATETVSEIVPRIHFPFVKPNYATMQRIAEQTRWTRMLCEMMER